MAKTRTGRIIYYNLFSHIYDLFISLHSGRERGSTRSFLVESAALEKGVVSRILDLCCGTGEALLGFTRKITADIATGCDFSRGMLRQASKKKGAEQCRWIECDVTELPFGDSCFDVVTCSHALYELKGQHRKMALCEMRRVVRPQGIVLIMEHEVPRKPVTRFFFNIRMASMGSEDAHEFVAAGDRPYRAVFKNVETGHTPSGKSKVYKCKK